MPNYLSREILKDGRIKYTYNVILKKADKDGNIKQYNTVKTVFKNKAIPININTIDQIDRSIMPYKSVMNEFIIKSKNKQLLQNILKYMNQLTGKSDVYVKPKTKCKILPDNTYECTYEQVIHKKLKSGEIREYVYDRKKIIKDKNKLPTNKGINGYLINKIDKISDHDILKQIIKYIQDNKGQYITTEETKINQQNEIKKNMQPIYPPIIYDKGYTLDALRNDELVHLTPLTTYEDYYGEYGQASRTEFEKIKNKQIRLIDNWRSKNDPTYV
jgi:hypothetical protein